MCENKNNQKHQIHINENINKFIIEKNQEIYQDETICRRCQGNQQDFE